MYYNAKKLFAPLIIPSILIFFSIIISWQWDRMLLQANIDNELSAFIIILPLIPYFLFAIVAILGARSKNTGLIFITIILSISYFILPHSAEGYVVNSNLFTPRIISFLLPINLLLFSFIGKKRLKFVIISLFIILIEVGIFRFLYYLIESPESEFIVQFQTEFPGTAASFMAFNQNMFKILLKACFINTLPSISKDIATV